MLPRLRTTDRLTVALCHERARECLALTLEAGPQPARHILEHIAESWSDIAAELMKAGSIERSRNTERSTSAEAARR
ncbi:MAG: hypothetical protein V7604_917 [Hyphomicrobiales bacterium]|jgi:hypothetical protein